MRFLLAALTAVLVFAMLPVVQPHRAQAETQSLTELDVTEVTPNVVQGDSPGDVVIRGRLTNNSEHVVDNVQARVQRGEPASSEPDVQQALRGEVSTSTGSSFTTIADRLRPGQTTPVELRVPLTGPDSLDIDEAGTYPLLVNVNGDPESSGRSRIAEENFQLPVLAPPEGQPQPPSDPTPTSMLVPLVDYPRMERTNTPGKRAVLTDDELAGELTPGGRLYDLVHTVNEEAGDGSPLGSALCFAIDPDLLATARAMSQPEGYLVRQPDGSTTQGHGGGAAELWLSKLREAVDGRCVLALPYADADVTALSGAGLPDVTRGAQDGGRLVRNILNTADTRVDPRPALWPIDGALDDRTARDLRGVRSALLDPRSMDIPAGTLSAANIAGTDMSGQPIDPLMSSALNPLDDTPQRSSALSPPNSGAATVEDSLGALAFRATEGSLPDSTSVLAPPRRWNLTGNELHGLFDGMRKLSDANYIEPTALPQPGQDGSADLPDAELTYPGTAADSEVPSGVIGALAKQNYKVGDLFRSTEAEPARHIDPAQVTTPLRNGLLRSASSSWRGDPEGARRWLGIGAGAVRNVLSQVHIKEFQGKIALAASNTAIPLTVVNDLPVTISVRLNFARTPGTEVSDLGTLRIPANSRRQFWPEAAVHRAGQFNLDVAATTEGGTQLSQPKRLQVDSSAYGPLIPILTGVAGGLLVVLSAIRIVRRTRAGRTNNEESSATGQQPTDQEPPEHLAERTNPLGDTTVDGDRNAD